MSDSDAVGLLKAIIAIGAMVLVFRFLFRRKSFRSILSTLADMESVSHPNDDSEGHSNDYSERSPSALDERVTLQFLSPNEQWISSGQVAYVPQLVAKRLDELKRRQGSTCRAVDSAGRVVDIR